MLKKLEEIKSIGAYSVQVWFGEGVGCDDLDVPTDDRNLVCIYVPVGHLGEGKVLFKGKVKEFLKFNFASKPKVLSNPPEESEYKEDGFYTWGTESYIERLAAKD